jgi:hypothetical protein
MKNQNLFEKANFWSEFARIQTFLALFPADRAGDENNVI